MMYIFSILVCDFDGIKFVDGAERTLECNGWWAIYIYFHETQSYQIPCLQLNISHLKSRHFQIPTETHFSVCACGKWICTSEICTEGYRDIENMLDDDSEEDSDEEDYDYDEDPEDDPDVQDINWF